MRYRKVRFLGFFMTPATHAKMVHEHHEICQRVALLISDLVTMRRADAGRAAYNLHVLRVTIRNHMAAEGQMIAGSAEEFDQALAWRNIERLHGRIVRDWGEFLNRWKLVTISAHWPEFRLRARKMLQDVRTLVQVENDQIYAPATRLGILH